MKLWHSFTKEWLLALRSMYFYVEILAAVIFLVLLLFIIPENFVNKTHEYLYYDVPEATYPLFMQEILKRDTDHQAETVDFKWKKNLVPATLYETATKKVYVFDDLDVAIGLADKNLKFATIIHMDDVDEITYTYYMQGYETERLRNIYAVAHNESSALMKATFEAQEVRKLYKDQVLLSDRESVLPSFLTFNGSLMGMFILASYIFFDKKEGVVKAYAVTPSPIWHYLLSKVGLVTVTSLLTSLMITIPVMGMRLNYLVMVSFLLMTGFAASALGLLLASFYDDIVQSFGVLYMLILLLMLPNIAYFLPTWDPVWMQFIPTYSMLEGFKEVILPAGDLAYVMRVALGYLMVGGGLFLCANARFKKTLTL